MTSTAVWTCILVVLVAVAMDVKTRRMPNVVTLGGLSAGLAIHVANGVVDGGASGALRGLGIALLGAFSCGIVPFLAWKKGEMGGGDVKLFAAIGALMGPAIGFDVQAFTFAFSLLVLFPYRLLRYRAVGVALKNVGIGLANVMRPKAARASYLTGPKLPPIILGPAIGLGLALALVQHGALR